MKKTIEIGLFKDWGVTNLKSRRKVTRKLRRKKLTDKSSEFAKPQLFEINHETGEIRGNIFYYDAQMPSQKPHVESNHEFIR